MCDLCKDLQIRVLIPVYVMQSYGANTGASIQQRRALRNREGMYVTKDRRAPERKEWEMMLSSLGWAFAFQHSVMFPETLPHTYSLSLSLKYYELEITHLNK